MNKFAWQTPPEPLCAVQKTYRADIVIIGAGHAGTCAARGAAEAGASVIVLEQQCEEKQRILGIGEIGHINSRWQAAHGVPPVDVDEFVNDWQLRTGNRSNARLIRMYAEQCGDCFDWFLEPLAQNERDSIHPMLTPPSPHMPSAINGLRAWPGSANMGVALQNKALKGNQQLAMKKGASFFFGMTACQLKKSGNSVSGVIAKDTQGQYTLFEAKKGILLAAGDYSKNEQMCRDLLAEADDLIDDGDWSGHGWDGSGIRMGVWAGGRLEPRSHAAMGGNYAFPGFDVIGATPVLRVNCHGKRYSNEGFGTHILAASTGAKQPDGMLWGVFDRCIEEQLTVQTPCHAVLDYTDERRMTRFHAALEEARIHQGESTFTRDMAGDIRPLYCAKNLEELACLMFDNDTDRVTFLDEVKHYNALCHAGKDTDFGKDKRLLFPVEQGPFYACGQLKDCRHPSGQSLKLLVTVSGLLIDERQQVLDEHFEPIKGLYATGNCSGCRFGFQYTTSLPGQSISIAQTLGREAGRYIAALA